MDDDGEFGDDDADAVEFGDDDAEGMVDADVFDDDDADVYGMMLMGSMMMMLMSKSMMMMLNGYGMVEGIFILCITFYFLNEVTSVTEQGSDSFPGHSPPPARLKCRRQPMPKWFGFVDE